MDYSITYSDSNKLHVVKTGGSMTGHDFIAMAEELLHHPGWTQNNNVLFDHRDLIFQNASIKDLETIRSFHKENEIKIGTGKSAILVKSGMAHEWHNLWTQGNKIRSGNNVQVFESFDKAVDWIRESI